MDQNKFKIDFFIAGFPKCGTTSLSKHISQHPEVCFSTYKEPCFFLPNPPDVKQQLVPDQAAYKRLFQPEQEARVFGEGSVSYVYSRTALHSIAQHNPDAKLVFLVRNPIDRTQSLHSHNLRLQKKNIGTLEDEWNAQENGCSLSTEGSFIFHNYKESGMQGKYLRRVYNIFPRKQVLTIVFDDMKTSPERVFTRILKFLGVSSDFTPEFKVHNEHRIYKSDRQATVAKYVTGLARTPSMIKLIVKTKQALGIDPESCLADRLFMEKSAHQQLSSAFKHQLVDVFKDDVEILGELISRDLMGWLECP